MLPVTPAMRRPHDAEWEMSLLKRHERRISPEAKAQYRSSRRRNWVNSSRRWIERRKELGASMTPHEHKMSRKVKTHDGSDEFNPWELALREARSPTDESACSLDLTVKLIEV